MQNVSNMIPLSETKITPGYRHIWSDKEKGTSGDGDLSGRIGYVGVAALDSRRRLININHSSRQVGCLTINNFTGTGEMPSVTLQIDLKKKQNF